MFIATKVIFCLTNSEYKVIGKKKTLQGFKDVARKLHRRNILIGKLEQQLNKFFLPVGEKSFSVGVFTTIRRRNFENLAESVDKVCDICRARGKQFNEKKTSNNELKKKPPKEYGRMFPYLVTR